MVGIGNGRGRKSLDCKLKWIRYFQFFRRISAWKESKTCQHFYLSSFKRSKFACFIFHYVYIRNKPKHLHGCFGQSCIYTVHRPEFARFHFCSYRASWDSIPTCRSGIWKILTQTLFNIPKILNLVTKNKVFLTDVSLFLQKVLLCEKRS